MKKLTNDQLYERLSTLEEFAFRVPEETLSIVKVIVNTKKPKKPARLGSFGKHVIYGKTQEDLLGKSIELLERIKYLKIEEVFDLLIDIVTKYEKDSASTKALKVIEGMTKYNLNVLKKVGYYPQKTLLKKIEKWSDSTLKKRYQIVLPVLRAFLKPSFEGVTSEDYKTFTFHFGALSVHKDLIDIRSNTIKLLERIYRVSVDVETRIKVIETLWEGQLTPDQGSYGDDLTEMIRQSISQIFNFYLSIAPDCENEVAKKIEIQTNWLKKRSPENTGNPPIEELETLLSSRTDYDMFKDFVGFDHDFSTSDNWAEIKENREKRIKSTIESLTEESLPSWKEKIEKLLKNYGTAQPGEFQYFNMFLFELGKSKPDIALKLINLESLKDLLLHLVAGIWKSPRKKIAKELINRWLDEGKQLRLCGYIFSYVEEADLELMEKVLEKATKHYDEIALRNLVDSIVRTYTSADLKGIFLKTVSTLGEKKSWLWLHSLWFQSDKIIASFSEKEVDQFLEALIFIPDVHYEVESVLTLIAQRYPEKVIAYFLERVKESAKRDFKSPHYDPIPFDLPHLSVILRNKADIVIPLVLKWYGLGNKKEKWRYKWEASQLISKVFPESNSILETEILKLIKQKGPENLETVYSILDKYEGEIFLFKIIESLLQVYKKDPKLEEIKRHLFSFLSKTGVVMGEYGFVEAYESKKKALDSLDTSSKELANFVKEYKDHLEKRIEYEKKRADEDITLRQKGYEE